jgi:N-methylhydantoinase B
MAIDPLTLDVFWSRLLAVVNEQAASLIRSAFSPSVAEAGDISACAFDRRGWMIAQAVTGTPGHINSMARCVEYCMGVYPPEALRRGDVLITNDPWHTSGHLHDVTIVTPVFREDGLVAFFGTICHMADIGGRPFSADSREFYEEGLFIPLTRLFEAGVPNEELFKIVRGNVRAPEEVVGDLYAMTAANEVGGDRLLEFMHEFGLESIQPLADEVIARSEHAMREAIAAVPDGTYRYAMTVDGYEEPVRLEIALTIAGDAMDVDYTGTSPASERGINVVMNYTEAYTTFGVKSALVPDVPNNEGSFRPVRITAPEGSILNCRRPSPVAGRHIIGQFLPLLVHGALAQAVPDRTLAEGSANLWNVQLNGWDRAGKPFTMLFFNSGGMGARSAKDGLSSTAFPSGVSGTPAEVVEARSPLLFLRRELRTDSAGPGRFRGGLGHAMTIQAFRAGRQFRFAPFFDRLQFPARGFAGGLPGARGEYRLGDGRRPNPKETLWLDPEVVIEMGLPGGGGFHDPLEREPEAVLEDVRDGYVSPGAARSAYGVVLAGDGVDVAATRKLRARLMVERR